MAFVKNPGIFWVSDRTKWSVGSDLVVTSNKDSEVPTSIMLPGTHPVRAVLRNGNGYCEVAVATKARGTRKGLQCGLTRDGKNPPGIR